MTGGKGYLRTMGVLGVGLLALSPIIVSAIMTPRQPRDARHCVIGQDPPSSFVPVIDDTDQLVKLAPRQVYYELVLDIANFAPGDRVVLIDARGDTSAELHPALDVCLPGSSDIPERAAMQRDVLAVIKRHLDAIATAPPSRQSPLVELIISIVSDPSLHLRGTRLTIALFTDGLQNSALQSAYRHGSRFPTVASNLLRGVTVEIHLLRNPRDAVLQPEAAARLVAWLKAAGADVRYTPPAWLSLAAAQAHPHHSRRSRAP